MKACLIKPSLLTNVFIASANKINNSVGDVAGSKTSTHSPFLTVEIAATARRFYVSHTFFRFLRLGRLKTPRLNIGERIDCISGISPSKASSKSEKSEEDEELSLEELESDMFVFICQFHTCDVSSRDQQNQSVHGGLSVEP